MSDEPDAEPAAPASEAPSEQPPAPSEALEPAPEPNSPRPEGTAEPRAPSGPAAASTSSNGAPAPGSLQALFDGRADGTGRLRLSVVPELLAEAGVTGDWDSLARSLCLDPSGEFIRKGEFFALVGYLQAPSQAGRQYTKPKKLLETGSVIADEAVLSYIKTLEAHKKKCETEGRYREASAASARLLQIRTQEEERLRIEVVQRHEAEAREAEDAFGVERDQLLASWELRLHDYDVRQEEALAGLQERQQTQFDAFVAELEAKRPTKARSTKELLSHRYIEGVLARAGDYERAEQVRVLAAQMERMELDQNIQAWEAEVELKATKLRQKHLQEQAAAKQRSERGRSDVLRARNMDMDRLVQRFRNIRAEIKSLQRIELGTLKSILDAQANKRAVQTIRGPVDPPNLITTTRPSGTGSFVPRRNGQAPGPLAVYADTGKQ